MKKIILLSLVAFAAVAAFAKSRLLFDVIKYDDGIWEPRTLETSEANAGIRYELRQYGLTPSTAHALVKNLPLWNYVREVKIDGSKVNLYAFCQPLYFDYPVSTYGEHYALATSGHPSFVRTCDTAGSPSRRYLYPSLISEYVSFDDYYIADPYQNLRDLSLRAKLSDDRIGLDGAAGMCKPASPIWWYYETNHYGKVWQECYTNWLCAVTFRSTESREIYTQKFTNELDFALAPNAFSRTGYSFDAWKWNERYFDDGATIEANTFGDDVTLTAGWSPLPLRVILEVGAGTCATNELLTCYDAVYAGLPEPLPEGPGWYFNGWNRAPDGSGEVITNGARVVDFGELTLYADWKRVELSLTLDPNGGYEADGTVARPIVRTVYYGDGLPDLDRARLPVQIGSSFTGYWTATNALGKRYYDEQGYMSDGARGLVITNDLRLLAGWTNNIYRLTLDHGGGTSPVDEFQVVLGEWVPALSADSLPVRRGYVFDGYTVKVEGRDVVYIGADGSTKARWLTAADGTLTARWIECRYQVVYYRNRDEEDGWKSTSTALCYSASFPLETLAALGFSKEDYRFLGWARGRLSETVYGDGETVSGLSDQNGATVALYARWRHNPQYLVTLDPRGGTATRSSVAVRYGEKLPVLEAEELPVRRGYTFAGYYSGADGTGTKYLDANGNPKSAWTSEAGGTVYARWIENRYRIAYYRNRSVEDALQSVTTSICYSAVFELKDAATLGFANGEYAFIGWGLDRGSASVLSGVVSGLSDQDGGLVSLYAQWRLDDVYTLTLNANGGLIGSSRQVDVLCTEGEKYPTLPTPTAPTGQTFAGWWTTRSGEGDRVDESMTCRRDFARTLYARWEVGGGYRVELDFQGGDDGLSVTAATYGELLPELGSSDLPTRIGYTFAGYYEQAGGSGTRYFAADGTPKARWMTEGGGTLYAKWVENRYSIVYYVNPPTGGSGNFWTAGPFGYSEVITLENLAENSKYAYEGYAFGGWKTEANADEARYSGGEQVMGLSSQDGALCPLYAHWQPTREIELTLTLDAGEGRFEDERSIATVTTENGKYPVLPEPIRTDGYHFAGWWTENQGEQRCSYETVPDRTDKLYARWKKDVTSAEKVKITFTNDLKLHCIESSGDDGWWWNVEKEYDVGYELDSLPDCDPQRKYKEKRDDECKEYEFFGWYTSPSGGVQVTEKTIAESNMTVYARLGLKRFNKWTGLNDVAFFEEGDSKWEIYKVDDNKFLYNGVEPIESFLEGMGKCQSLVALLPCYGTLQFRYLLFAGSIRVSSENGSANYTDLCEEDPDPWRKSNMLNVIGSNIRITLESDKDGDVMLAGFEYKRSYSSPIDGWDSLKADALKQSFSLAGVDGWKVSDYRNVEDRAEGENGLVVSGVKDSRFSEVAFRTNEAGRVMFKWRTDCERGYYDGKGEYQYTDRLELRTNGVVVAAIDGEQSDFAQYALWVPAGCEVAWRYVKDADVKEGKDKAWLDDFVFTPRESSEKYTVTFQIGEGEWKEGGKQDKTVSVDEGGTAMPPEVKSIVDGATFEGWNGSYSPVLSDLTLKAIYVKNSYVVTFELGEHATRTGGGPLKQIVSHGEKAEEPIFKVAAGWDFIGWSPSLPDVITADNTFKAQYNAVTITNTVTFTVGEHGAWAECGSAAKDVKVEYGKSAEPPPVAPTVNGWSFEKWQGECKNVTSDRTITALYTQNVYTVEFVPGEGGQRSGGGALIQLVVHGGAANAPALTAKPGMEFVQWDSPFGEVTGDLTVKAEWRQLHYQIDLGGEVGGDYVYGESVTASTAANVTNGWTNIVCLGWTGTGDVPASGTGCEVTFKVTQASSLRWVLQTNFWVEVTAGAGGAIEVTDSSLAIAANPGWYRPGAWLVAAAEPAPDYLFAGWMAEDTGDRLEVTPYGFEVNAPVVLTAEFTNIVPVVTYYTVTFELGDHGVGAEGELTQQIAHGGAAEAPEPKSETGWRFTRWNKRFDYVVGDLTVTAEWEKIRYPIDIGGAFVKDVAYGEFVTLAMPASVTNGWTNIVCCGWTGTGDVPTSGDGCEVTFKVTQACSLRWVLQTNFWVEVTSGAGGEFELLGEGAVPAANSAWYEAGTRLSAAATPATGYAFAGWLAADMKKRVYATPYEFTVEEPSVFSAEFTNLVYAVTFDLAGQGSWTGGGQLVQTVAHGGAAKTPTVEGLEGWSFIGWEPSVPNAITEPQTFVAQYEPAKFTVTFDLGGYGLFRDGTRVRQQQVVYGATAVAPTDFDVLEGWAFLQWDRDFDNITADQTVTARYARDLDAGFAEAELTVVEGDVLRLEIGGGDEELAMSMKLYVSYQTAAASDLNLKSGIRFPMTLTWAAGDTEVKTVEIPVSADSTVEKDETLIFQLVPEGDSDLGTRTVCRVTIHDPGYDALQAKIIGGTAKASEITAWNKLQTSIGVPYITGLADSAAEGKVTGSGYCAEGKKVTLKATANKGQVFRGWYAELRNASQKDWIFDPPVYTTATLVFDRGTKPGKSSATQTVITDVAASTWYARFISVEEDRANVATSVNGLALDAAAPRSMTVRAGVYVELPVAADALSATTVSVTGLPAGLKFTAKDVVDSKTKAVTVSANTIYGAPTTASKNGSSSTVKVKVTTAGKTVQNYTIKMLVSALPERVQGSFYGGSAGEVAGSANLTVSAAGKISGKWISEGKTWMLAANSFSGYDEVNERYSATVTAKNGKQSETLELAVDATGVAVTEFFEAFWANWKVEPWKTDAKEVAKFEAVDYEVEGGAISIKFGTSGTVKTAGSFYDEVTGKLVKASGSATLLPADCGYLVFIYLAPKNLPVYAEWKLIER